MKFTHVLLLVGLLGVVASVHGVSESFGTECSKTYQSSQCGTTLVCTDEDTCGYCSFDSECIADHVCVVKDGEHACVHKPLFPLSWRDVLAMGLAFFAAVFAASGGIGGGGPFVPLFMIVTNFDPHHAAPLSKAMIFGGSCAVFALNCRARHPRVDRPLIDFDVALCLEPMTLAGTVIGVLLNAALPSWVISLLLIIVLGLTSYRTLKKGYKLLKADRAAGDLQSVPGSACSSDEHPNSDIHRTPTTPYRDLPDEAHQPTEIELTLTPSKRSSSYDGTVSVEGLPALILGGKGTHKEGEHSPMSVLRRSLTRTSPFDLSSTAGFDESLYQQDNTDLEVYDRTMPHGGTTLADLLKKDKNVPFDKVAILLLVWTVLLVGNLLKGGHGAGSMIGIDACMPSYWVLVSGMMVFTALVTLWVAFKLNDVHKRKVALNFAFSTGDVIWNKGNALRYPLVCLLAGIVAGLLGIGGGMIIGPLLLEIGMQPVVAAATSSFMILFTASSTTSQFIILGMLQYDYAAVFVTISVVASLAGQLGINYLVKKYNFSSLIVICLAGVIAVSTVIFTFTGVMRMVFMFKTGQIGGFTSLC